MTENAYREKALALRQAFDESFVRPAEAVSPDTEDMLAVRAGGNGYALRAREIAGLEAGRKVLPVPGGAAAFLGLAGLRGGLVPVWDLAALLGYGGSRREARWIVLGLGEDPWALAFDAFEGYFRVARSALRPAAGGGGAAEFCREACDLAGAARPVVSIARTLEAVKKISQRGG